MRRAIEPAPASPETGRADCGDGERALLDGIAEAPENAEAYAAHALLLENRGCPDEAERCHRKAVAMAPESVAFRFNLANFLAASDRDEQVEEAKSAYLEIIRAAPEHFGAWNNIGTLLFETGYTSAAQTALSAAVAFHPREAGAHVNLGNVLLYRDDLATAETQFDLALALDPDLPTAHQGLAVIHQRRGKELLASRHRDKAFRSRPIFTLPHRGRGEAVPLLILASALEGNVPWRFLIDSRVFETTIVAVEYFEDQAPLPPHRLIFNAIGDADLCRDGLAIAKRLVANARAPVLNRPDAVLRTGRVENAKRLAGLPGVVLPAMATFSKTQLGSAPGTETLERLGFAFPLLLRAPGYHGGYYFLRVDAPDALAAALENLPGDEVLAMEYLDPRAEDSLFRKYRVMSIDGRLYPIHMAVSAHWKVHYFSSDMAGNADHRAEEERFLRDFAGFLGPDAISALERIDRALGLDYCGMDFGLDREGRVLLYEANATMVVNPPTQEKHWDYKRTAIESALAAAKRMFAERAANARFA